MSSPDGRVDLRSDTVTTPTAEMRAAMARADVGDDAYGEDPTVNRLQEVAAERLGTESALYVTSGTLANQLALRVLGRPGTEILCGERAHVYRYEHAATAGNAGVQLRPLPDPDGLLAPSAIQRAAADAGHHLPPLSGLAIENPHMPAGGRPWPVQLVADVAGGARAHGLAVHCDGARIWNAATALDVAPRDLCRPVDTVMFCLSKGLAAPIGSVLCGASAVIEAAWAERARLGGAWRQAGVIAAAGLVALDTMVERLGEDHTRARRLADALAARWPHALDPDTVRTNIVCADVGALPAVLLPWLEARGIRVGMIDARTVRFVTHKDVDDDDLDRTVAALDALLKEGP